MTGIVINRRNLLRAAGGAAVVAAGLPLAQACGSGDDDSGGSTGPTGSGAQSTSAGPATGSGTAAGSGSSATASSGGGADSVLPTFQAKVVVPPDLPGDDNGTPDAYLAYPANPVKAFSDAPLKGGSVSVLKIVGTAVPPPVDKNPFWQELNKRVGTDLKMNNIIASDYPAKVQTTVAGGDLPDLMQMGAGYASHLGDLLKAKFQDLSKWLSGDAAAKNYPYLAALPTISWKNVKFNDGIYGIPYPLGVVGSDIKIRQDIFDKVGVSAEITSGDEFLALCKKLTDVNAHRWAVDTIAHAQSLVNQMLGVPNDYKVEDGKFTNAIQTDEYKQGLDICQQMWKAGQIYPDSVTSTANFHAWFFSGQVAISTDGYTNWMNLTLSGTAADPNFKMGGLVLPKWEGGGQAAHYTGSGIYTFTVMKKASDARVEELLRMLNWFATPFGTEEYLFRKWGIPGRHYNLKGTDPVETKVGVTECQQMNTPYIATAPQPLYIAGMPDLIKTDHSYLQKLMQVTAPLPTVGLISETDLSKGSSLNKTVSDAVNDVVMGRKKVSDWDGIVKTYLSGGGDAINQEYSDAYAKANG
jgi:putative aldouronate transport system substrate-binding protein